MPHFKRTERAAQKAAEKAKREARLAAARAVVATGKCPQCGRPLRRNLSLTGWWQCSQLGAPGFRADSSQPSCDWQTFTE
jgi:hypothetical protein